MVSSQPKLERKKEGRKEREGGRKRRKKETLLHLLFPDINK
jgi:hypothetical protein